MFLSAEPYVRDIGIEEAASVKPRRYATRGPVLFAAVVMLQCQISPAAAESLSSRIAEIAAKADVAYGEYLAGQCVTCHHEKGADNGIPVILGLPDTYFIQTMLEYRNASEERTNPVMVNIAKNLSDDEIGSLAKYFSTQRAN